MPICSGLGDNGSQQTLGKCPCEAHVVPRKDSIARWALRNPRACKRGIRGNRASRRPPARNQCKHGHGFAHQVGRFGPAKALRILRTSKDHARQTLIQSAFMIRTGLLPVADCQSCFVAVARPPDPPCCYACAHTHPYTRIQPWRVHADRQSLAFFEPILGY